tara:strand:- start:108 stop:338 length:231 start_codon:yes stop_codon:yes gene_type:complete
MKNQLNIDLSSLPKTFPRHRKAYCVKSNLNTESAWSHGNGNKARRRARQLVPDYRGIPFEGVAMNRKQLADLLLGR